MISGWAQKDATAAATWVQQLPPGQLRNRSLNSVINAMATTDPEAAFSLLQSSGMSGQR